MIIYGRNVIREALGRGVHLSRAYLVHAPNPSEEMKVLENSLQDKNIPCQVVTKVKISAICHSKEHQGIAARIKDYRYSKTFEILFHLDHAPFIIILDRVQDPHNVGAIIRTAYGAGADLLILALHGGCPITPAVLKTSAGYAFRMPISVETNLARTIDNLKKSGIWVYGATAGGKNYLGMDLKGPIALVFGNEGGGIRRLILKKCDGSISIPMARAMDSLNVSVSAAVITFKVAEIRQNLTS